MSMSAGFANIEDNTDRIPTNQKPSKSSRKDVFRGFRHYDRHDIRDSAKNCLTNQQNGVEIFRGL